MRHATALAIVLSLLLVPCLAAQSSCPTVPPPTVTLVAGQNPACVRNTLTLEASSGYAAYRWSDGVTTRQRTIFPWSDGRTYTTVVGIDANGCESQPTYYYMDQGSTLNVNLSIQGGSQFLCDVSAVGGILTADSWGGGPVVSRRWEWRTAWDGPGTTIPGATGQTYQVRASDLPGPGEYFIACVVTPTCGTPKSHTYYVHVGPLQEPSMGWTPKVCLEGTGGGQIFGGYEAVLWTITNGEFVATTYGSPDPTNPNIGFRALGPGTVTLTGTVTGAGGCTTSKTVEIPVQPPVPPQMYGPTTACPASQHLMVAAYGLEGARQWSAVHGTLEYPYGYPNYWDEYVFVTPDGSGLPIEVTVNNEPYAGCFTSSTHTIAITNEPAPITIQRGSTPACVGGTETVYASVYSPDMQWTATNATILGQSYGSMTFRPTSFGPVTISVTSTDNGCPAAGSFTYTPPNPNPPDLRAIQNQVCPGENGIVDIRNTSQYSNVVTTIVNGTLDPDSIDPIRYVATGEGPVTITVQGQQYGGCTSVSSITIPLRDDTPRPVIQLAQPTVCPGGYAEASIQQTTAPISWSITNGYIAAGNGTNHITFYANGSQPPVLSVTVSGPTCQIPSEPVTVPFTAVPAPVITLGAADVCPYSSITASVAGAYDYLSWNVTWGSIESGQGTNTVTVHSTDGTHPPQIYLMAYKDGCQTYAQPVTVPLRTLPPPVITLGSPNVCPYSSVTASVTGTYDYMSWNVSWGTIESGQGTNTVTIHSTDGTNPPQIYLMVYKDGCQALSQPVTVPLRTLPPPVITLGSPNVCPYSSVTASVTGTYDYMSWNVSWGTIESGQGTNTVTVHSTDGTNPPQIYLMVYKDGCQALSQPVTVPLRTLPPPVITLGSPNVCPYTSFTASAAGTYDYMSWNVLNGTIEGGQGTNTVTIHSTDAANPPQVYLMVYKDGCQALSQPVTVPLRVLAPPAIQLDTAEICAAGTDGASVAGTYSIYFWTIQNGTITAGDGTNHVQFQASGLSPVVLRVMVGDAGCTAQSADVTVPVTTAEATITPGGATTFCEGQTLTLTASEGAAYAWTNGATTRSIVVEATGSYAVKVTTAGGCEATSAPVAVTVNAAPAVAISTSGPLAFCAGGSVTLTASAAASYLWSNGATTQSIDVAATGSYSVTVTNANGCSATSAATVVTVNPLPAAPSIDASGPLSFCEGGSVTLTAPAGFSYLWSNGATTQSIDASTSGSYSVTVTNANGCSATSAATVVTVHPLPATPAVSASGATAFCAGGSVTLTAPAGFSYLWSNGATTQSIDASTSGSYSVTVTNTSGCSATSAATSVTVSALPSTPAITPSGPTTFCEGGSVTLTAPAGFSYLWSTGETTQAILANASGSYSVTITNANGCSATSAATSVTVNALPATPAVTASGPTTFCTGGSVTLTAPAGYSYLWSNGATTQAITANASGSYSVTVTNANGCSATNAATAVTVNALPATAAITPSGATTFCEGGSVTLTAPAGFTYLWSTAATTQAITVSTTGSYTVTVTNANGCSATSAATAVTVQPLPPAMITPSGPTTFCQGGSVTLGAPIGSYTYLWSNGSTSRTIPVSTSGTFTVTVTGANGCAATSSPVTVTVNLPVQPAITADGPTTFCPGGSVNLTATEGSSYLWSTGATTRSIVASPAASAPYWVEVTDANGCMLRSAVVTVSVATQSKPTITNFGPTTFCSGGNVTLGTSQGAGTYLWSNGATTANINVTQSGTYSVTITNATGCSNTSDPVVVTVLPRPTGVVSGSTTYCGSGSATIRTDLTGVAPFTVFWSDGVTQSGITASFTERVVSPASSRTYTATIADANCSAGATGSATITVRPAMAVPTVTAQGPTTVCAGTRVTLEAPAGTYYTYLWSNGSTSRLLDVYTSGSYSVTVTDVVTTCSATSAPVVVTVNAAPATPAIAASGPTTFCSGGSVTLTASAATSYLWSNGATTQSINVSTAGSYSVTVTNASGCSATSSATTVTVTALPTATITAGGATTFCAGGSVTLTASSGASYLWSNGATIQSINASTSGSYTVTVTNASGCSATSAPKTVTVTPLPIATVTAGGPTTFCAGSSVTLTASSGTSYLWSNGATTQSITVNASGSYSVTVSANGCSATSSATTVTVNALPTATITAGGPTTFCAGGSVTLTASAGSSWLWSNGATTQSINVTTSGSYTVTVTNASGCSATSAATSVAANALPNATITSSTPMAFCAGSGVSLDAPFSSSYLWSNGATTRSIYVTTSGTWSVTVTNSSGCSATLAPVTTTKNTPVKPTITAGGPTTFCRSGSVTLTSSAGASYLWSNGATTQSITVSPTATTSYRVDVTGANGCTLSSDFLTVQVDNPEKPNILVSGANPMCGNSVTLRPEWVTGGYTYVWSNGYVGSHLNTSQAGTYTLTVSTPSGCSVTSDPVVVTSNPVPSGEITAGTASICAGGSSTITATLSGTAPFTATWSDGVIQSGIMTNTVSRVVSPTTNTTYWLNYVTDAHCTGFGGGVANVYVSNPPPTPVITATGPTTFCQGGSVGLEAPTGNYFYTWSNGATTRTIVASTSGNYTVTVRDAQTNCSTISAPTVVTVNPQPSIPTVTAGGPTTFCAGGSVTLNAPAGYTYLWSNGATTQSINVTASGSYNVRVTAAGGCFATSASTTVTVNPTTTITQQPQSATIARNATITLSVTATGANRTYQWYKGTSPSTATPISAAAATTYTTPKLAKGTYTYWVRVTGTCGVVNSTTATITVP